ncbi:MAG: HD domain-containing phosphohydrolase [Candidatus Omnitrophota bacterium]|nr:HD domain-containing phosphohydrolase [Candidatus Omnitrophota bacterium]MDZ4242326.1 HD domain-containing phosphohydrolase [Candidatus Omnitrophota bacterium]
MNFYNSKSLSQKYKLILSAVHMVYRLVNSTYNVRELSLRLTRLLCQFIKADSASVLILDPQKKRIILIAIFDNKINILLNKRRDIARVSEKERKVAEGQAVFEKRLIGLPLVADDNVGAIFIRRRQNQPAFTEFDREMLSVVGEQAVTAIKNLQLYEQQQGVILGSMKFIGNLLERQGHAVSHHTPVYFKIVKFLAEKLSMGQQGIECLHYASILHAAGALDVPYDILSKTSQLSPEEFKVIRSHPAKSVELIRPVEFLKPVLPIILYHHEKYDGTGYPSGLKKEQIPMGARIMSVVDAFEAMIRGRPYRKTLMIDEALEELKANSGTQFDPNVVGAFCDLCKQKKFRNYLSHIKK